MNATGIAKSSAVLCQKLLMVLGQRYWNHKRWTKLKIAQLILQYSPVTELFRLAKSVRYQNIITSWRWHILSIPLKAGRGISAETCGLDDVFPPDDLGSGPCTPFIVYTPHIIAAFLLIQIYSFEETYIPKVGLTMLVYWMIWYCAVSGVLLVVCSSILYVMVWI